MQDLLATVCHTDVSVGSVGALEQAVSAALATPVAEAANVRATPAGAQCR